MPEISLLPDLAVVLETTIDNILNDSKKIKELKNNLNSLKIDNSATIIYENLKKLVNGESI